MGEPWFADSGDWQAVEEILNVASEGASEPFYSQVEEAKASLFRLGSAAQDGAVVFLREYRADLEARLRAHLNEADSADDEGAHIGLARHHRALASGLHEAILALDVMWRTRDANSQSDADA